MGMAGYIHVSPLPSRSPCRGLQVCTVHIYNMRKTGIERKGGTNLIDILELLKSPSPGQRQKRLRQLSIYQKREHH